MRTVVAILAFLLTSPGTAAASAPAGAPDRAAADESQHAAAEPAWHTDLSGTIAREAWDFNGNTEWLAGAVAGVDRRLWRAVSARGEALALRVAQQGPDAWLRGFTLGTRFRTGPSRARALVDVAVGLSNATVAAPPRGTRFNYLAVVGAGVELPCGGVRLTVTGRWLHASNNGREGRARNPDIQALAAAIGIGWEH